jgi:hypothetical protein
MSRFPSIAVLVLAAAPALAVSEPARPVLPFIENDYPRALSEARAKKLPIFAEAWAPW